MVGDRCKVIGNLSKVKGLKSKVLLNDLQTLDFRPSTIISIMSLSPIVLKSEGRNTEGRIHNLTLIFMNSTYGLRKSKLNNRFQSTFPDLG